MGNSSKAIRRMFISKEVLGIFLILAGMTLIWEINSLPEEITDILWPLFVPEYIAAVFIVVLQNVFSVIVNEPLFWVLVVLSIYLQAVVLANLYVTIRYVLSHLHWDREPAS